MYELVVVWGTGEMDIYKYNTEEEAENAGRDMKMVFGGQISWYGTRRCAK